ncbi:hypothetical protein BO94DRAFT_611571 [Aspergillus sclerotioniger CBS 115572]|uniref:Uncharacterized protein n=1 Tax=Aspergillus sclerotioniger CBS 115572 TaxID=1450535 RepID=A0A317V4R7_9EURO|nr:hypothetical protein BO94DRAFT_611571 [Aspergillus sclerotioniger CBS 115572]PWY68068.1 hypothetical protein BO94DRAFT_611571 [Aspergillus sclerotioniger CBS 115572]
MIGETRESPEQWNNMYTAIKKGLIATSQTDLTQVQKKIDGGENVEMIGNQEQNKTLGLWPGVSDTEINDPSTCSPIHQDIMMVSCASFASIHADFTAYGLWPWALVDLVKKVGFCIREKQTWVAPASVARPFLDFMWKLQCWADKVLLEDDPAFPCHYLDTFLTWYSFFDCSSPAGADASAEDPIETPTSGDEKANH